MSISRVFARSLVAVLLAGACSRETPRGAARIVASSAGFADGVTRVTVAVWSGDGAPLVHDLALAGGVYQGILSPLPAGACTFNADAFDASGVRILSGSAQAMIVPGTTTVVAITLEELQPPAPVANGAPVIDWLTASTDAPAVNDLVDLNVSAHDSLGEQLSYAWSATSGSFPSGTNASGTHWQAGANPGPQTITVTVANGAGSAVSQTLTLQVQSASGASLVSVALDYAPRIDALSMNPGQLGPGQSAQVLAQASDTNGDELHYAWSVTGCEGSFSDAAAQSPTFTLAGGDGTCTLQLTVTTPDGASCLGSLSFATDGPATALFPPRVDLAFASQATAKPGDVLGFDVLAHDPQQQPLTFVWSATSGSLGAHLDDGTHSAETWTSASCAPGGSAIISVVISNTAGLSTTQSFKVASSCGALCVAGDNSSTAAMFSEQPGAGGPLQTFSTGIHYPRAIAFDAIHRTLWVGNQAYPANLTEYALGGDGTPLVITNVSDQNGDIAGVGVDPGAGLVFALRRDNGEVDAFSLDGTPRGAAISGLQDTTAMTVDPVNHEIWTASIDESRNTIIAVYGEDGSFHRSLLRGQSMEFDGIDGIAVDPVNNEVAIIDASSSPEQIVFYPRMWSDGVSPLRTIAPADWSGSPRSLAIDPVNNLLAVALLGNDDAPIMLFPRTGDGSTFYTLGGNGGIGGAWGITVCQ